jgi:hypothetical protein
MPGRNPALPCIIAQNGIFIIHLTAQCGLGLSPFVILVQPLSAPPAVSLLVVTPSAAQPSNQLSADGLPAHAAASPHMMVGRP